MRYFGRGDDEAQLALRFSIYHLLIAAPRHDERVNIGAKPSAVTAITGTFWDTEIFMLPFFTFTRPEIAKNLLSYRYHNLPGAREKALEGGFQGAQFLGKCRRRSRSDHLGGRTADRKSLIRIWTGDIEIHISSDIAFALVQYWRLSGDDDFMVQHRVPRSSSTAPSSGRRAWNGIRKLASITSATSSVRTNTTITSMTTPTPIT